MSEQFIVWLGNSSSGSVHTQIKALSSFDMPSQINGGAAHDEKGVFYQ